jgi:hypothetical protein
LVANLLAALAVPYEARMVAVEKTTAGEESNFATAMEIVAQEKKKRRLRRHKTIPAYKPGCGW